MGAIEDTVKHIGPGPLTEDGLRRWVFPLFSRVLARSELYLANHSLGRPLDQTAQDVASALDAWYEHMDDAWGPWLDEMTRFRTMVAKLIGVSRADAVVPKSSAGQALRAVLNALKADRPRVLATRGEFDSCDFILKVYDERGRAEVTWVEPRTVGEGQPPTIAEDDLLAALRAGSADLLLISHVYYATGQVLSRLQEIVRVARDHGTHVFLDCYHSAGVVPVDLERIGADFAAGGSYKYTRGGPGACWLAIHPRHLDGGDARTRSTLAPTLDTGWFAKADTFKFERPERPLFAGGGDAWLESTMAVLPFYQARAGLEFTLAVGVERLRAYSLEQQAILRHELRSRGVRVVSGGERGAFLLLPGSDTEAVLAALKQRGVNADARLGFVRVCPDVLTTRDEISRGAAIIADVMNTP